MNLRRRQNGKKVQLQAAMEGFAVKKLDSVISTGDIFVTATGNKGIIMKHQMA